MALAADNCTALASPHMRRTGSPIPCAVGSAGTFLEAAPCHRRRKPAPATLDRVSDTYGRVVHIFKTPVRSGLAAAQCVRGTLPEHRRRGDPPIRAPSYHRRLAATQHAAPEAPSPDNRSLTVLAIVKNISDLIASNSSNKRIFMPSHNGKERTNCQHPSQYKYQLLRKSKFWRKEILTYILRFALFIPLFGICAIRRMSLRACPRKTNPLLSV